MRGIQAPRASTPSNSWLAPASVFAVFCSSLSSAASVVVCAGVLCHSRSTCGAAWCARAVSLGSRDSQLWIHSAACSTTSPRVSPQQCSPAALESWIVAAAALESVRLPGSSSACRVDGEEVRRRDRRRTADKRNRSPASLSARTTDPTTAMADASDSHEAAMQRMPAIPKLEYPIVDPAARQAAYVAHRSYIDECVRCYSDAGVLNAADYIERCTARWAALPALEFVGSTERAISYAQLESMATRMAHRWIEVGEVAAADAAANALSPFSSSTVARGGALALLMENCPLFVVVWYSLAKVGRTAALLNTSVTAPQLIHALTIARAEEIVISARYRTVWEEAVKIMQSQGIAVPKAFWSAGSATKFERILWPQEAAVAATATAAKDVPAAASTEGQEEDLIESCLLPSSAASTAAAAAAGPPSLSPSSSFRALRESRGIGMESPLFYIYTSGTTGPSKAAIFSHRRFMGAGLTWSYAMELTSRDRYYIALPLFHGNGGVVAVSAVMHVGALSVIREKFSVRAFWPDVQAHRITAMIYVGELWRYLHNAAKAAEVAGSPPVCDPASSTLRVIAGNGLRPDIWTNLLPRFGVRKIVEHYGMTEMPAGPYINFIGGDLKPGACGFIPPALRAIQAADKLVKFDVANSCVMRVVNEESRARGLEAGMCVEVTDAAEAGEALFLLAPGFDESRDQRHNPHTESGAVDASSLLADPMGNALYKPYRNYTDVGACMRRVYRSVFRRGDAWFSTGDLLRLDAEGFFTFVDRIGDSFRWKGENVATNEVAEVISGFGAAHTATNTAETAGAVGVIEEANVYGVEWPGQEGRAGMACLVWKPVVDATAVTGASMSAAPSVTSEFDPSLLLHYLLGKLAPYAIPAFIRLKRVQAAVTADSAAPSPTVSVVASSSSAAPVAPSDNSSSSSNAAAPADDPSSSSASNAKTSTLKFQKFAYAAQGFNPAVVGQGADADALFWWPGSKQGKAEVAATVAREGVQSQRYVRITPEVYQQIIA